MFYGGHVNNRWSRCHKENAVSNEVDDLVFDILDKFLLEESKHCSTYVHNELDLYLEEPTFPKTQEFDIIHWWQYAGVKYPT
jgi:hypothetical protein